STAGATRAATSPRKKRPKSASSLAWAAVRWTTEPGMRRITTFFLLALPVAALAAAGSGFARLPGGDFKSALKYEDTPTVKVAPFELQKTPVTNAEFLAFVQAHPEWRRDRVARVLADERYLQHWAGPVALQADAQAAQPVVNLRWFAASAYCQARGCRPGANGNTPPPPTRPAPTRARTRRGANASLAGTRARPPGRCRARGCKRPTLTACRTCTAWYGNGPMIFPR